MNHPAPGIVNRNQATIGEVQAEIRQIEMRVRELEEGRDSAYEKALIRTYEHLLTLHRQRLDGMLTS